MIVKIADEIISPLAVGAKENFLAVKAGKTALQYHERAPLEPFMASIFETKHTATELAIEAAKGALAKTSINPADKDVLFIVSTTKGDIYESPSIVATNVASYFSNLNTPITVCNACISGAAAQLLAMRELESGKYHTVIVIGVDVLNDFIVSGFQSFKALSIEHCKPFDKERKGLNLGEAGACIIYQKMEATTEKYQWVLSCGAIRNDANHISGPSRTGEGSYRALKAVLEHTDCEDIAFINVHGTATLYNDEMESWALVRANLANTPINALKGYYGHTLGAAGVLESILSMHAVDEQIVLPTLGFSTLGVPNAVSVSSELRHTVGKKSFIKILSGFGGCNIALLFKKGGAQ